MGKKIKDSTVILSTIPTSQGDFIIDSVTASIGKLTPTICESFSYGNLRLKNLKKI
jgi:hypothetical protein